MAAETKQIRDKLDVMFTTINHPADGRLALEWGCGDKSGSVSCDNCKFSSVQRVSSNIPAHYSPFNPHFSMCAKRRSRTKYGKKKGKSKLCKYFAQNVKTSSKLHYIYGPKRETNFAFTKLSLCNFRGGRGENTLFTY